MYVEKQYAVDTGFRMINTKMVNFEDTFFLENIIYNELICRGYSVDVGVVELRETGESGKQHRVPCEIDFVVNRGPKRYYIQAALNIDSESKAKTELRPLMNTGDFFKKIIITKTTSKSWFDENGICHLGLYEFLLNEQALDF